MGDGVEGRREEKKREDRERKKERQTPRKMDKDTHLLRKTE